MDALLENRDVWESVDVVMKKPPHNVDCANAGVDPDSITEETCLYDGPTRGICPLFPRNVNTHASIAYAGIASTAPTRSCSSIRSGTPPP